MKKTWLICLVLASFVCGCQSKKESNAVLFEKFLDKNVASFAKVMAESGVDTIQAKKYCRCVFTQLYGIDSTFFKLPNDSINSLIDKHSLLIIDRREMWKSEEMIITIIPLYSRKSVSLVILSLSVETSC